jgi:hypothetical protein
MANEEKLRSELRHHIETEMMKANSEDDLTQDEIAKSSLFANELRAYLKSPESLIDQDVNAAAALISNKNESRNVWEGIPAQSVKTEIKSDSLLENK